MPPGPPDRKQIGRLLFVAASHGRVGSTRLPREPQLYEWQLWARVMPIEERPFIRPENARTAMTKSEA